MIPYIKNVPTTSCTITSFVSCPNPILQRLAWRREKIALQDSNEVLTFFSEVWKSNDAEKVAQHVLSNTSFGDEDLTQVPRMVQAVAKSLKELEETESEV